MAYIGKSPDGTGVRSRFYYTQTSGGGTSVTGSSDDGTTLTFSDGAYVDVYLNGVLLVAGTDYNTTTANTISGLAALANGDVVEVVVYDIFTVADTVSALNGGTFSNNVTINGDLTVDTNTLFVDASADVVGINTTSPDTALHVKSANDTVAVIESTDATSKLQLKDNSSTNGASLAVTNETFSIQVNGGTRATIDSSGNVLVGTTNTDPAFNNVAGQSMAATGQFQVTRDGGTPALINRKTDDGTLLDFRKDGGTVGSISTSSSVLRIFSTATNYKGLAFAFKAILPTSNAGADEDNSTDLGSATTRFDDVHATNGTIQTSDENEKQQIASLTTAEITAAKAISKLFKTFKWNSSVTENGDAARTHTGVIAQEVRTAMTEAGLDASKYAFWCSDTWWEADATYTDDDGVEQTHTLDYKTAEEAPEGATQRTRLGIRYPELLAFIGAATEQRLADLETRVAALENA